MKLRKVLSLFVALVMMFEVLPLSSLATEIADATENVETAAEAVEEEIVEEVAEEEETVLLGASADEAGIATISEDDTTLASGDGWSLSSDGVLTIEKSMTNRYEVDEYQGSIPWYSYIDSITSVVVCEGVTSICDYAFINCYALTDVTLPSTLTQIGYAAFAFCYSLTQITLPDGLILFRGYIHGYNGTATFKYCGLTSIALPDGISSIDSYQFQQCSNLKSINIPSSVTSIQAKAFDGCKKLTDVYYDGTVSEWNAISISSSGNSYLLSATIHCSNGTISPYFTNGYGTEENPYQVATAEQLDAVRYDLTACYIQVADIDLSGIEWTPIGDVTESSYDILVGQFTPFKGTYNGNNYTITGMTIRTDSDSSRSYGLFASCSKAVIENVTLSDVDIYIDGETFCSYVGGIVGIDTTYNSSLSTIQNCTVSGSIVVLNNDDTLYVGGIVGYGAAKYCTNYANISIESSITSSHTYCGGICGQGLDSGTYTKYSNNEITYCVNYGDIYISTKGYVYSGGISGSGGPISVCVNYGDITGITNFNSSYSNFAYHCNVGGIVGVSTSNTNDECVNFGNISSSNTCDTKKTIASTSAAGGIAGYVGSNGNGSISNCYNLGSTIYAYSADNTYVAGRVAIGRISGNVITTNTSDCYSIDTATVNGVTPAESDTGTSTIHGESMSEAEIASAIKPILDELGLEYDYSYSGSYGSVYYLTSYNEGTGVLELGGNLYDVYVLGDDVDTTSISNMVGSFVLITKEQDEDNVLNYTVTSIVQVESAIGEVTEQGSSTLTIDGTTYPVRNDYILGSYEGDELLYHVYDGTIVGYSLPETSTGTLDEWDNTASTVTIDGTVYPVLSVTDLSFLANVESYLDNEVTYIIYSVSGYTIIGSIGVAEESNYEFDPYIYRANILLDDSLPYSQTLVSSLQINTPSGILVSLLQANGFESYAGAWEALTTLFDTVDKPASTISDLAVEQKDIYSAVILTVLEASMDADVLCGYDSYFKQIKSVESEIMTLMKAKYNVELSIDYQFSSYSADELEKLTKATQDAFKELNASADMIDTIFKDIGVVTDVCDDLESLVEYIGTAIILYEMSDSMKTVINTMYDECPISDTAMKLALLDVYEIVNSSWDEVIGKIYMKALTITGEEVATRLVDEFWKEAKKAANLGFPALDIILAGYKTGKWISNTLFSTDSTIEQYYHMLAILNVEDLLVDVNNILVAEYVASGDTESAQAYLSAIDVIYNARDEDCVSAYEYIDILDNALANQIGEFFGSTEGDSRESIKSSINSIQKDYTEVHEQLLTSWIGYLEEDYPGTGLYEKYYSWYAESLKRVLTKKYVASCPVDVYVYDSENNLVASVIDNEPYCSGNLTVVVDGDTKTLYFYDDEEYRIEYVGNDTGTMDIVITEYDSSGSEQRNVYYYDLELTDGLTYETDYTGDMLGDTTYVLTTISGVVTPDLDTYSTTSSLQTVTIDSGHMVIDGEQLFEITAYPNEEIDVYAYVPDGYEFFGWTSDVGDSIFEDSSSQITVLRVPDSDVAVTAVLLNTSVDYSELIAEAETTLSSTDWTLTQSDVESATGSTTADKISTLIDVILAALGIDDSVTVTYTNTDITEAIAGDATDVDGTDGSFTINFTISAGNESDTLTETGTITATEYVHTHSLAHVEAVDATCTAEGNTEYWYCSGCDKYYSDENAENEITFADTVTAKIAHNYEAVVTEPTCTEGGYTTYTCSVCKDSYVADETAALGHDYTSEVTKEATCTEAGVMTYTCTRGDDSYTEEIPATGHTEAEAVAENEVAATCTTDGSYDSVVYCTVCGEELSRETIVVPAAHTAGTAVRENVVEATRTTEGSYDLVTYCTVCGEEISRETVTVPATGVDMITVWLRTPADYSAVNNAIAKANVLNSDDYTNFSDVTDAINAVNWTYNALMQSYVNEMAEKIETAIANLVPVGTTTEEVEIQEPIEDTNTDTEEDEDEPSETSEPESNPATGIAFSVLPMVIAALVAASAKRR